MTAYLIIALTALLASALTLVSGFGLGTLLTPVFALFFPPDVAIALTAAVHFLTNLFKLALVGRHADRAVVLRFGLPALLASLAGAALLLRLADLPPLLTYALAGRPAQVTVVKLTVAVLIVVFALLDLLPAGRQLAFDRRYLPLGGLLSGFFGGLSGNQGALRSAFLIRAGLDPTAYVATGVVIACLVDVTRLGVYADTFRRLGPQLDYGLLLVATLSAFAGAYGGSRVLRKTTIGTLRTLVAILLLLIAAALGAGVI